MGVVWDIIVWIVSGLVIGFIARAIVPGKDHIGIWRTIVLGVAGSVIGGLLWGLITGSLLRGEFNPLGWIGSIIVAVILLLIYNRVTGRKRV